MPRLKLVRFGSTPFGTFGRMVFNDNIADVWSCFTVERPWAQNRPTFSCIPAGLYPLTLYDSPRHGRVYLLQNVPQRANIEIHIANVSSELEGCIAPGKYLGWMPSAWAVQASATAFKELMMLPTADDIFISWQPVEES